MSLSVERHLRSQRPRQLWYEYLAVLDGLVVVCEVALLVEVALAHDILWQSKRMGNVADPRLDKEHALWV